MELHHPIMSKLRDLGGQTYRTEQNRTDHRAYENLQINFQNLKMKSVSSKKVWIMG